MKKAEKESGYIDFTDNTYIRVGTGTDGSRVIYIGEKSN